MGNLEHWKTQLPSLHTHIVMKWVAINTHTEIHVCGFVLMAFSIHSSRSSSQSIIWKFSNHLNAITTTFIIPNTLILRIYSAWCSTSTHLVYFLHHFLQIKCSKCESILWLCAYMQFGKDFNATNIKFNQSLLFHGVIKLTRFISVYWGVVWIWKKNAPQKITLRS